MTFPELLITLTIITVVMAALTMLIQTFYKDNKYLLEETSALDGARRGLNQAIKDIRESSYGDDGSYLIASAATSSLTIYSDTDQDTSVERIQFILLNGTLYKRVTNASGSPPTYPTSGLSTTTLVSYVRNSTSTPVFSYFDSSGVQLSTTSPAIAQISSIRVQLMVDLNPLRAPNVFTLSESATLRNLLHD